MQKSRIAGDDPAKEVEVELVRALVIDHGGHGVRASVFGAAETNIVHSRRAVVTERSGDRVELDPEAVWSALESAAIEAIDRSRETGAEISCVGLATERSTVLAWRRSDLSPLTPMLSWQDTRAADWLARMLDPESTRSITAETGLHPSAHHGASKLRSLVLDDERVRAAAASGDLQLGPSAAWLVARLTGEAGVDAGLAQRTLLWSRSTRTWSDALCARFELEPAWLPPVRRTGDDFGEVRLGGEAIPLNAVGGDQAAAAFANGWPDEATWRINLGTGAFVLAPVVGSREDEASIPCPRLLFSEGYDGPGGWYRFIEGTVHGAAVALEHEAERSGLDFVTALESSGGSPPLFVNTEWGTGSPDWRPSERSRFVGDGTPAERIHAVGESVVFAIRRNVDAIRASGRDPERVVVSGGLSRSDRLVQAIADLLEVPVVRDERDAEGTSRGVAQWLLRVGARAEGDRPERTTSLVVEPDENPALAERFRAWSRLIDAMS